MRTLLAFVGSLLGSLAFQITLVTKPEWFQHYGWTVKYVWIAWGAVWIIWLGTHPKIWKRQPPLRYWLKELPTPKNNNYATELTVRNKKQLMLTVDIRIRTLYSQVLQTCPTNIQDQLIAIERTSNLSHIRWVATKGLHEFKLEIHTFQPLRIESVTQAN